MNQEQEKSLAAEKERGRRAAEILDHPLFQEAWKAVADALAAQRRRCPIKDTDMAVRLVLSEQMLVAVHSHIEQIMTTGKMAEIQIREAEEAAKRGFMARALGIRA